MTSNTLDQQPQSSVVETNGRNVEWKRLVERAVALEAQLYGGRSERPAADEPTPTEATTADSKPEPFIRPRFSPLYRNLSQLESESLHLLQRTSRDGADAGGTLSRPSAEHARAHALLGQRGFDPDRLERQAAQVRLVEDVEFLEPFAETDLDTWLRLQHEWAILELCESARQRSDASSEALWEQHAAASWDQRRRQLLSFLGGGVETFNLRSALSTPGSMVESRVRRDRTGTRAGSPSRPGDETVYRLSGQNSRSGREREDQFERVEPRSIFEKDCAALVTALVRQAPGSASLSETSAARHSSWLGSDASLAGSGAVSARAPGDAQDEPLALGFARAAHKWSRARSASRWPYASYAEACYDVLCAVLGAGALTLNELRLESPASSRRWSKQRGPFKLPTEGLFRPTRGHRLRFVCGALDWLQKQFHLCKLRPALEREPEIAALGGKQGTLAEVRAYLRVMELTAAMTSRRAGWLTEDPFAEIYFCLRCGDITAAVEAAREWLSPDGKNYSGDDLPRFLSYLEAFERNARRRYSVLKRQSGAAELTGSECVPENDFGGLRGTLNPSMVSQMTQDYALFAHRAHPWQSYRDLSFSLNPDAQEAHRRSVERDIFKRVCYVLIGRLNSAAPDGMELLDMDYDVLFAAIEDYLWMRLWTCRLTAEECEAETKVTVHDGQVSDDESLMDECLPGAIHALELRLEDIQEEMQQFGPGHFDPHGTRPHFYAMVLLLTSQFDSALAYLVQCGIMRASGDGRHPDSLVDAVHLGLILNYYGAIEEVVHRSPDVVLYDYAAVLWRYLQRERLEVGIAKSDPTAATAYIMTIRDAEQRFTYLCKLVMDTREFSLLLGAMIPDTLTHRPGLIERFERTAYTTRTLSSGAEWTRVAYACAESCEIAGDVVHAAMLFELAGDIARVISLLVRALCATQLDIRFYQGRIPRTTEVDNNQLELAKQARACYEKYEREGIFDRLNVSTWGHTDNHTIRRLKRSLEVALELTRFFKLVYDEETRTNSTDSDPRDTTLRSDERYEAAFELQKHLGLIPLSRSDLAPKAEALRPGENYEDVILERVPVVLLAFMHVVHALYEKTRRTLRTLEHQVQSPDRTSPATDTVAAEWRFGLEQRLHELRELAHTMVTFSGMLTFMAPSDTAELVRLEMMLT
ncbi:hypothetical protein CCYA_CCYA02G0524 [Cyanidiococcus yangmingshanensis]|nr:hypothetical protein CCYA_CCYA02G0524 [Cyanidiococcus yangmingshanensis]